MQQVRKVTMETTTHETTNRKPRRRHATKRPPRIAKVDRAGKALSTMDEKTQQHFSTMIEQLERPQLQILVQHLRHHVRKASTLSALDKRLEEGTLVKIVHGDPRFIGMSGLVKRARRIRCYIQVAGINKPIYLFTSDVEPVNLRHSRPPRITVN